MADEQHLRIFQQGLEAWNLWRTEHRDLVPDLSGALLSDESIKRDLSRFDLNGANLRDSMLMGARFGSGSLQGADLRGAHFRHANFTRAQLTRSDFSNANLLGVNLRFAKLSDATLVNTVLQGADLSDAALDGADLTDASMGATQLGSVDLSATRGLEAVSHFLPSPIGIDTIYRSKGRIPERFLRGCGVPENLIRYIPSLVNSEDGIQFYSCFISYSTIDGDFARRLHGRMRDAHLRVWFAPEDVQGGKKLHEQIDRAIRVYDKLLIVLSEASVRSEWVMTELRKAFNAQKREGTRKLFPVRLVDFETLRNWECFDADSGQDLAVEIREYFIPDFTRWKEHDRFEAAFRRLLADLRAAK